MNGLFGGINVDEKNIEGASEVDWSGLMKIKIAEVSVFYTNDGTTGFAANDSVSVFVHGYLSLPLPDWNHDFSPLDDLNVTAEYLLSRYVRLGTSFLNDVHGNFSVALNDSVKTNFVLSVDPAAHGSMFYSLKDGVFCFSTNLYQLGRMLGRKLEINREFENFFLVYGFYPWSMTAYKDVFEVPPRTLVVIDENMKAVKIPVAHINMWGGMVEEIKGKDFSESQMIDILHESFLTALKDQLPSTKKVAVLLGGFDSALVAAGLKALGKDVETFSFYYEDGKYNQPLTDVVSKFLGTDHTWVKIDADVVGEGFRNYPKIFNKPTNWPNYVIQTQYLAKKISEKGYKHCFSGDGCDYMFFGYPITHSKIKLLKKLGRWPSWLVDFLLKCFESEFLDRKLGRPYHVGLGILRSLKRDMNARGMFTLRAFDEFSLNQLRNKNNPESPYDTDKILRELSNPYDGFSLSRLMYTGKQFLAPYKIKINGSYDSTGLIINSPYLHPGLQNLANHLPDHYLRPEGGQGYNNIGKYILAKMADAKGMLPQEVIYQKKVGAVDAPIEMWYSDRLSDDIFEILKGLPFEYNADYIKALLRPKLSERLWAKLISRSTNNLVTLAHAISLLLTYAAFTELAHKDFKKD